MSKAQNPVSFGVLSSVSLELAASSLVAAEIRRSSTVVAREGVVLVDCFAIVGRGAAIHAIITSGHCLVPQVVAVGAINAALSSGRSGGLPLCVGESRCKANERKQNKVVVAKH